VLPSGFGGAAPAYMVTRYLEKRADPGRSFGRRTAESLLRFLRHRGSSRTALTNRSLSPSSPTIMGLRRIAVGYSQLARLLF
jgi:hypothetical protein